MSDIMWPPRYTGDDPSRIVPRPQVLGTVERQPRPRHNDNRNTTQPGGNQMAEPTTVAVVFSIDDPLDADFESWLTTALVGVGARRHHHHRDTVGPGRSLTCSTPSAGSSPS